jgi:hypothetical protein
VNTIKIYASSILAFLFGVFAASYFNGCGKFEPPVTIKYKRDTTYVSKDTVVYRKLVKDTTIYVDTGSVSFLKDTVFIVKDYNSINIYKDTLSVDYGYVYVVDTVTRNSITGRSYKSSLEIPIYTDSVIIKEKLKTAFFWGFSGGIVDSKLNDASVNLFMETSKRKLYGVGVGVSDGKPVYRLTALIKL